MDKDWLLVRFAFISLLVCVLFPHLYLLKWVVNLGYSEFSFSFFFNLSWNEGLRPYVMLHLLLLSLFRCVWKRRSADCFCCWCCCWCVIAHFDTPLVLCFLFPCFCTYFVAPIWIWIWTFSLPVWLCTGTYSIIVAFLVKFWKNGSDLCGVYVCGWFGPIRSLAGRSGFRNFWHIFKIAFPVSLVAQTIGMIRYSALAVVQVSTACTQRHIFADKITVHAARSWSGLHHKVQVWLIRCSIIGGSAWSAICAYRYASQSKERGMWPGLQSILWQYLCVTTDTVFRGGAWWSFCGKISW